ncbi:MAG: hypothetical protein NT013_23985 [Planctomycetia bacterium]|nr:hypothetical protein [Planctomycetia bacterium]
MTVPSEMPPKVATILVNGTRMVSRPSHIVVSCATSAFLDVAWTGFESFGDNGDRGLFDQMPVPRDK